MLRSRYVVWHACVLAMAAIAVVSFAGCFVYKPSAITSPAVMGGVYAVHPLDGLSAAEYGQVVTLLEDAGRLRAGMRFSDISVLELVLRMSLATSNYEYIFDWVFTRDGRIVVEVGSAGIDLAKGVTAATMNDPAAAADTAHGTLIAPHIVAPNHSHFFSFRFDLDVDGASNTLIADRLVEKPLAEGIRKSIWVVDSKPITRESEGKFRVRLERPAKWRVENPNQRTALGHHPGYVLMPKSGVGHALTPSTTRSCNGEALPSTSCG